MCVCVSELMVDGAMGGAQEHFLPCTRLMEENRMLTEAEVASVIAPVLGRLSTMHARGQVHGNVSLATMAIDADGGVRLLDPDLCAVRAPCAACQQAAEGPTEAADVWDVGIVALHLLLGRTCRDGCCARLVDRETGDLQVMACGTSLECIDFLMDCLALRAEDRATARHLTEHEFIRMNSVTPQPTDESVDLLTESLADTLLIPAPERQQEPACRPPCVPTLKTDWDIIFTAPSHTARCLHCRCRVQCSAQNMPHPEDALGEQVDQPRLCTSRWIEILSPATNSAASTKRKLSPQAPAATSKRKCNEHQQPSKMAKCLSPAILLMVVGVGVTAPYIEV